MSRIDVLRGGHGEAEAGEDIDLAARVQPDLGRVRADPGQVEQVTQRPG